MSIGKRMAAVFIMVSIPTAAKGKKTTSPGKVAHKAHKSGKLRVSQ